MFALEALVPTLCSLVSQAPPYPAQVTKIFEQVSNAVANRVKLMSSSALPSFSADLNTLLEPLLSLFNTITDKSLQGTLCEILFGLALLRGSPREVLMVAEALHTNSNTTVSPRLAEMIRSLVSRTTSSPVNTDKDESLDEKIEVKSDETKAEKEDRERREKAQADRRRRAELKKIEAAQLRARRVDKRLWPWHPDLVLESFAPTFAGKEVLDGKDEKEGKKGDIEHVAVPALNSRIAALLLLQHIERNEYPDEVEEGSFSSSSSSNGNKKYPSKAVLKLSNGLAASMFSGERTLRATYASSEPTQQQILDLDWSADGRKVTISYSDKSFIWYPDDGDNVAVWSSSDMGSWNDEKRAVNMSLAQFIVVRPNPNEPNKVYLRSARHGWYIGFTAEHANLSVRPAASSDQALFTIQSAEPAAASSSPAFERMTFELHPSTFVSLVSMIDRSSIALSEAKENIESESCALLSALNIVKFHLTRYATSRAMTGKFSTVELGKLSQLFFTDLPARAHKIADTSVRAAVEASAASAVELGL